MFMQQLIVPIKRYAIKVITNCFRTVSHEAAYAEANLTPISTRLEKRVWKFWINIHTLPKDHLMWICLDESTETSPITAYRAPTTHIAKAFSRPRPDLETIDPFAIAPWQADTRTAVHITEDLKNISLSVPALRLQQICTRPGLHPHLVYQMRL